MTMMISTNVLDDVKRKAPDDPDSLTPLPIYRKGLKLIQKEYRQKPCRQEAGKPIDENHQGNTIKTSNDPLHIHGGPITRVRAKKMQAALNGLIEKIWIENAIQDARHHELGLKRRQGIVGIIQVIGQPNTQFVSNAERSNSE